MNSKTRKLAIESLLAERQRIAFDANLFDLRLACYPKAKRASERRKQIDIAIAQLRSAQQTEKAARVASPKKQQMEMFPEWPSSKP